MNQRLRVNLTLGLLALTAIVAYLGIQGYMQVNGLILGARQVEESGREIEDLRGLLFWLRVAESSQRGYLLTGKESYLGRYDLAGRELNGLCEQIGGERSGPDRSRLAEVSRAKLAELDETIALRRSGRPDEALALVQTDSGEMLTREAVAIVERINDAERSRLVAHQARLSKSSEGSLAWMIGLMGGTLCLVAGLCIEIGREARSRRRSEAGLRESEERFRGSFEVAAIGMALVAPDGRFLKVNRSLVDAVGYTEAELLATDFQAITHPDDLGADLALMARLQAGEIPSYRLEKRYLHKSGRVVHIVLGVSIVRDDDGRPLHYVAQVEDITPRRLAEEKSRESERRFRAIFDHTFQFTGLIRPDGTLLETNRSSLEFIAAAREDVVGRPFWEGPWFDGDPATRDRMREAVHDAAAGRFVRFELTTRGATGETVNVDFSLMPILDEAGEVVLLIPEGRDITERTRLERRLIEQLDLAHELNAAFEHAVVGISRLDRAGRFASVNRAYASMLGRDSDELIGHPWSVAIHPDDLDRMDEAHRVMLDGGHAEVEVRGLRLDGSVFHKQVTLAVARDRSGAIVGSHCFVKDIDERKRADRALFEANFRLDLAVRGSNLGIWDWDLETGRVYRSDGLLAQIGRAPGDLDDTVDAWKRLIHPDDLPHATALVGVYLAGGSPEYALDHRLRHRDGSYRWITAKGIALRDDEGRPLRMAGIHIDNTKIRAAEDELRAAKEAAESALRVKGEFLANMSHEIRTPMNGVLGMAELALGTALTARQHEYIATIKTSAESLLTVIDDILDFSKVEAGKLRLDRVAFSLRDGIDDTLRPFAPRAHAKGLELCARVRPDVPDTLIGDPHRLRQILVNLVGNAVKFTESGEVVVNVDLDRDDPDGTTLAFSVLDTGIGIPENRREAIFAPFEQADGSTTRKYGGTGLGLAISAKLVALMGGSIRVDDRESGGCAFRFTARFGRAPLALADDRAPREAPRALSGRPVVILDDNATSLAILAEMLDVWRMDPVTAATTDEALASIRSLRDSGRSPVALLVDGVDAALTLVEEDVPMILLATEGTDFSPETVPPTYAARLLKPVRQSELYNALTSLVGEGRGVALREPRDVDGPTTRVNRPLRVLLAEDNLINQAVARQMLERLGQRVDVVGNGRLALDAFEKDRYDLVLMDVQMPVMDGFQAMAAIRAAESGTDRRTTVIALTAHAMAGDRERCLGAGFDDYLSKPIRLDELSRTLKRLAAASPDRDLVRPRMAFQPEALAESCGRIDEIIADVLATYLGEVPREIERLVRALGLADRTEARRIAHSLKGASLTVGAEQFVDLCEFLESIDDDAVADADHLLRIEIERIWAETQAAIRDHQRASRVKVTT